MDTRQIDYFLALYREGSVRRAAETLFLTQQGLSRSIMELESELGVVLFHRSTRGLTPTRAGDYHHRRRPQPVPKASDWGWQIDPKGLRWSLNEIYARYGIPMMVVENGLGAYDEKGEDGMVHDTYRIDYLRQHIEQIKEAVKDGVDLMGYTPFGAASTWCPPPQARWPSAMASST